MYCVQCARKADLANFIVLQQYTFEDLCNVFDQFRLNPVSHLLFSIIWIIYLALLYRKLSRLNLTDQSPKESAFSLACLTVDYVSKSRSVHVLIILSTTFIII